MGSERKRREKAETMSISKIFRTIIAKVKVSKIAIVPVVTYPTGLVKDVGRCRYLARKADEVVRSLKPTDYRFSLGATIKSYKAEKVAMHFVNVKINFELKTF